MIIKYKEPLTSPFSKSEAKTPTRLPNTHSGYKHAVNSHINRLRAKIEKNPNQPEYIQTVWGVGYKFRDRS